MLQELLSKKEGGSSLAPNPSATSDGCQYWSKKTRRIKKLQFGIVNLNELRESSVTQAITINNRRIPDGIHRYETVINGERVYGGANDPRLGNLDDKNNPGFFGHINLAKPVYHPGFFNVMLKVLRCICFYCCRLRMDESEFKFQKTRAIRVRKHRLEAMHQLLKDKKTCDHCNSEMPKFTKIDLHVMVVFPDGMGIFPENGDKKQYLPAAKVVEIFKRMRDEDIKAVGLDITWARPEWLLVSVLPVPPIHMRPSLFFSGGVLHSEDDLTHQIVNIVKSNIALKNSITHGEPNMIVEQFEESLQYNVAAYMDNEMKGLPQVTQRSGRPLKTLKQRLQGKEGRIRGNLMGKRVDFSARAVITPDPHLGIEQVGVPKSVAMNLTVSEHVTPLNILQLSKLVAKGPMVHPGAKYIIQKDGTRIDLRYIKDKANLQLAIGWIVERHLHDNDIVVFNRQPSLHKMSIMGHRVKVLDGSTFRLNLSCTSPYNADFDGDEMNLHVPQSLPARVEAEQLMLSSKLVVSGQSNKPVMGVVQDALLAVQKMTKRDVFIERDLFFNLLMWVHDWDGCIPPPAILKPKQLWTGKQVMSLILPKINLKGLANKNSSEDILQHLLNPYDKRVTVIDGVLVEGIIDKKTIGCCMGGLIHTTWLDLGCEANAKFMNQIQDVVNYWILHSSFSVGVIDTILDMDTANKISNTIDKAKKDVQNLLDKGNQRELEAQPGRTVMESFEQYVNKILNAARDHAGMTAQEAFTEKNALKAMVIAGSKGSSINISQIVACVGQQSIEGNRIPCGFHRRSLPHFSKYDLRPESRGFVENAYITGLTPHEFFFHAMAGRECLIDTACKTADTGYVQRRLVKALETAICCYDGTVRTSDGKLVQFLYGEDGMDAVYIEHQKFESLCLAKKDFLQMYELTVNDDNFGLDVTTGLHFMEVDIIESCKNDPEIQFLLDRELEVLKEDQASLRLIMASREIERESDPLSYAPGNIRRIIANAIQHFRINRREPSDLHPKDIIAKVNSLIEKLNVVQGKDSLSVEAQANATLLYGILVRSILASKRVLLEFRLNEISLDWILAEIKAKFFRAKVNPGEMTGVLAAQSISEPVTQMTLDTFHYAGVSSKNVTLGVPRLKEILHVSTPPRTPGLTVYLQDHICDDQDSANLMHSRLECIVMGDIAILTEIHYDPDIRNSVVQKDIEFVRDYYGMSDESERYLSRLSRFVLRIELDRQLCYDKRIEMNSLVEQIQSEYGQDVNAIATDDNAENLIVRIRIVEDEQEENSMPMEEESLFEEHWVLLKRLEKNMLSNLKLRGVDHVKKVFMKHDTKRTIWNDEIGFIMKKEWVLETEGSNLLPVLSMDYVDATRTISNDIVEVFMVFGIEGVRRALLNELRRVLGFDGCYINYRHLALLVDAMTMSGRIMSIDRHGINRAESAPLLRCSFEEAVMTLMDAGIYAEEEVLNGVTGNIMLGQLARIGTGDVDLLLNGQNVIRNAFEVIVEDNLDQNNDTGPPTPYATTPLSSFGTTEDVVDVVGAAFSPLYFPTRLESVGGLLTSPSYNPTSPNYSPTSPAPSVTSDSLTSPAYSPTSPAYSITSPSYSVTSPAYSASSPLYSVSSPTYSISRLLEQSSTSPTYLSSSPAYSPHRPPTPSSSPLSPIYSPISPAYSSRNS